MSKTLRYASAVSILGVTAFAGTASCSDNGNATGSDGGGPDSTSPAMDAGTADSPTSKDGAPSSDGRAPSDGDAGDAGGGFTYTLIDDMETTTHGPIEYTGVNPPLTPGYWFNLGAKVATDTATPPITMFTFTALPSPTTTLNGKVSMHAAHQLCALNGQYDVCGLGFEIAQMIDLDAGTGVEADAGDGAVLDGALQDAPSDGSDAGPPIPKVTVPFDISQYKGIVFWAKATTADAGTLDLKVQFPDTDTDPRGGVCNAAAAGASDPTDTSQCYNSYAVHEMVSGDWQEYKVMFSDLLIDPSFGYQNPGPWDGKRVYGVNWQGQKNSVPDAGVETIDFWVDDVYFIQ